jgi:hypothetical protein
VSGSTTIYNSKLQSKVPQIEILKPILDLILQLIFVAGLLENCCKIPLLNPPLAKGRMPQAGGVKFYAASQRIGITLSHSIGLLFDF